MFVGASRLFPCDEATCDGGEIEPPDIPFTSGTAVSTVTTTGSGSLVKLDCIKWRSSGSNCCETSSDNPCYADCNSGGWKEIQVSSVSSTNVTYSPAAPTIQTGSGGKFYRPSDDVLLVQNIDWRAKSYVFTGSGGGSYTSENEYYTSETIDQCACEACIPTEFAWPNIGPGPPVTYSLAGSSFSLRYLAVARYNVNGISLTPTGTGVAQGLWTIKATGGQIVLESESGLTFSYSGTLTAVRNQIQAAGYFTATISASVVVVGGSTNAKTSDLVEFTVETYSSTACLPIVLAGTHLAPSSTGAGFSLGLSSSTFRRGIGYEDNQSGLDSYLTTAFNNPTLLSVQLGYGTQIFYPGPFLFYLPMHFENTGSGASTVTSSLDCTFTGQTLTETGIVTCVPVGPDGYTCPDAGPGCIGPAIGGYGCVICIPGGGGPQVCDVYNTTNPEACCYFTCQSVTPEVEPVSIVWTQSVTGSFSLA